MPNIKLLPTNLINQIAAGEVIERPYSVLKELIENSIDAKSTQIDILIQDGGHKTLQVFDNGYGMSKNNLSMAFKRHATSKIATQDDLSQINTLGFRGEALPSIASVSQLSARSILSGQMDGFEIKIHGGEKISLKPIAGLEGTQISVKNIFYNIPARRKFLKKPDTEQRKVVELVRRFMLSNPNIGFSLSANGKEIYKVSPNSLEGRIKCIFGKNFSNSLLPVSLSKSPYSVTGYTGNLNTTKKRQGEQYLFINGRFIKDRLLNSAVFSAYRSLISRGEFPFFILFLDVPLDFVDINVHPAKMEVRFQNEWHIYHVIKTSITKALEDILKVIPDYDPSLIYYNQPKNADSETQLPLMQHRDNPLAENVAPRPRFNDDFSQLDLNQSNIDIEGNLQVHRAHERIIQLHDIKVDEHVVSDIIWQLHNKYLITEIKSGLIIIGNGDVVTADDYIRMIEETGCDAVMIGRGALGNPWIFKSIKAKLSGQYFSQPTLSDRAEMCKIHFDLLREDKHEKLCVNLSKKHFAYYLKGFPGAAEWRSKFVRSENISEIEAHLDELLNYYALNYSE